MAIARMRQIDPSVARWYHCMTRCVRRAFLLKKHGELDRKAWIEDRIAELAQIFAVAVGGFAIMRRRSLASPTQETPRVDGSAGSLPPPETA